MKNYANAKDVLPAELFQELKKHCTGMLYVPETRYEERRKLVLSLHIRGTGAKEIAMMSGLGPRRVHQIIAEECHKNALLDCTGE